MADPSITNDERSAHNATLSWIARGRRGQQRFRTNGFPADDTLHMLAHVIAEKQKSDDEAAWPITYWRYQFDGEDYQAMDKTVFEDGRVVEKWRVEI